MGRISDLIPPLYFKRESELGDFIDSLDIEVSTLEDEVAKITDLVDVDRCPEEYLPYLGALTNCPLLGSDPKLLRRQIRNWPYILKVKGTEKSLEIFLNSIGVTEYKIRTWFRDADGDYTEDKPDGEPFLHEDGLWRNVRTHYFSVEVTWNGEFFLNWREWRADFIQMIKHWMERVKPFHAELLRWQSNIKSEDSLHLYLGIATFRRKHIKLYPEAVKPGVATLYHGVATSRFGWVKVMPERVKGAEGRLYAGVAVVVTKNITISER